MGREAYGKIWNEKLESTAVPDVLKVRMFIVVPVVPLYDRYPAVLRMMPITPYVVEPMFGLQVSPYAPTPDLDTAVIVEVPEEL